MSNLAHRRAMKNLIRKVRADNGYSDALLAVNLSLGIAAVIAIFVVTVVTLGTQSHSTWVARVCANTDMVKRTPDSECRDGYADRRWTYYQVGEQFPALNHSVEGSDHHVSWDHKFAKDLPAAGGILTKDGNVRTTDSDSGSDADTW